MTVTLESRAASHSIRTAVGRRLSARGWLPSVAVIGALLVGWQISAETWLKASQSFPPPTAVVGNVLGDLGTYWHHLHATLGGVWPGWLFGNLIATVMGALAIAIPRADRAVLHIAVAITSLPIIALGPIFQVTLNGDTRLAALAGLSVFFTTLVGTMVGLRACDRSSLDMVRALGGGSFTQLSKVRIRAALPDYFAALRISAPAAVLGGIIGEFIGGADKGLGIALISARANANPPRVWGIALVATLAAGVGYLLIALVGRLLCPWAPGARGSRR
jgi:ABC-type nitrate/sulfonate/bicarbonate transport system permease component